MLLTKHEKPGPPSVFIIEGLDRLGKGTLINNIINRLGYYQVIHMSKPVETARHRMSAKTFRQGEEQVSPLQMYQRDCFATMFATIRAAMSDSHRGAKIIYDRGHLGECVYAPLYRGYSGEYVFSIERDYLTRQGPSVGGGVWISPSLDNLLRIKLILLTEDFSCSKHFQSDGESFDDSKRVTEQEKFISAFNASIIPNKRMVCVTDKETGQFRDPNNILSEVLWEPKEE